jgi:very-short-patch-repair endonuclease
MRARLLDLSANNRLLNYRHPKGRSLRVINEVAEQLFGRLIEGKSMYFAPLLVPREVRRDEASGGLGIDAGASDRKAKAAAKRARDANREARARDYAAAHDIDTSYELPMAGDSARYSDGAIQTLREPEELEELLRKMEREAKTYVHEQGANRLHLMFGFVEWREPGTDVDDPKIVRLAPLVLLPVQITRGVITPTTRTYRYDIAPTGEDWDVNVTFREKCKTQFDFEFPDMAEDEELNDYVIRVRKALISAPEGWSLKVMVTLGFVSFGKILMWRDLDPTRWPPNSSFFKHEPIGDLLGQLPAAADQDQADGSDADGEYALDNRAPDTLPPVVVDADSSQHSALIDALGGKNMVIQGPPGTGKSQTITNLIAAAMWEGKRVLFVAEKRAALDVVYRRLEAAGLAPFVLALHSHTAQKRELLDDLRQRILLTGAGNSPSEVNVSSTLHRDRELLNAHIARLHGTFGALEASPYAILWRARRLLDAIDPAVRGVVERLRIPNATSATRSTLAEARHSLDAFSAAFEVVASEAEGVVGRHPWAGVTRDDITNEGTEHVLDHARELREAVNACLVVGDAIAETLRSTPTPGPGVGRGDTAAPYTFADAEALGIAVDGLRPPDLDVPTDLPWRIVQTANRDVYGRAIQAVGEARAAWAEVVRRWNTRPSIADTALDPSAESIRIAIGRFGRRRAVADLERLAASCEQLDRQIRAAHAVTAEMRATMVPGAGDALVHLERDLHPVLVLAEVAHATLGIDAETLGIRGPGLTTPGTPNAIRVLSDAATTIRKRGTLLDARFAPISRPDTASLRAALEALSTAWPGMLAYLQSGYRAAVRTYRMMAGGVTPARDVMLAGVRDVLSHEQSVNTFSRREDLQQILGPHARGVESPLGLAEGAANWYVGVESLLQEFGHDGEQVRDSLWAAEGARILEFAAKVTRSGVLEDAIRSSQSGERLAADIGEDWATLVAAPTDDVLRAIHLAIDEARSALVVAQALSAPDGVPLEEVAAHLADLSRARQADREVDRYSEALSAVGIASHGPDTDLRLLQGALAYLAHLDAQGFQPAVRDWLVGPDASERVRWLQATTDSLRTACHGAEQVLDAFRRITALDEHMWLAATDGPDLPGAENLAFTLAAFARQRARLDLALSNERGLYAWLAYQRARGRAGAARASDIVQLVERKALASNVAADAYEAALHRTLANAVLAAVPQLHTFSGPEHESTRQRFQDEDIRHIRRTQQDIAKRLRAQPRHRGIAFSTRVTDLTDEGLIMHEAKKKTRHVAIRELFLRAGRAIGSLKPCVMMGPQAVAQYLRAGQFEFDLIVMDEASQMRPEDALGAIARGKQVVIVGDPMQLGPSAFFDAQSDAGAGEDDDDYLSDELELPAGDDRSGVVDPPFDPANAGTSVLERSESILTAAAQRYPVRMLRWHYRSRHPKLIAFSNREFYHGGLIVFPTPSEGAGDDGVVFRRVGDAVYGEQRNPREAERIVEAVRAHALEHPERTLMVATMNLHQADLIDALIEHAEKNDPALAEFRARHAATSEPFEIKNLENVQGDERDVVMVSVTAGPDSNGKLSLSYFGAVTKRGGQRRLNVLFTRARHRTEVFCSFDPSSIRAEGKSEGVRVMRDYLLYAADAGWAVGMQSGRAPDSDFEVAVIDALRAHGWTVHPQVGIAGYFIDLAIAHPDYPGRYLLGVECDGATYHSAKSARDRDRLRQSVLEGLGWTIHRIWSTDWFRDPVAQAARVTEVSRRALERERAAAAAAPLATARTSPYRN